MVAGILCALSMRAALPFLLSADRARPAAPAIKKPAVRYWIIMDIGRMLSWTAERYRAGSRSAAPGR